MQPVDDIALLPVYARLGEIAESLEQAGVLILHAETGAGKTTLVPWHLLSHRAFAESKIILLQPRRIAARAAAERIAALLGEKIGQTVGLRTRLETVTGKATRLEVITEGVLTRILQNDQSLDRYGTLIFDEFHERNLQSDLALALAWDCRETLRPGLRLLFMSATPPAEEVRAAFGPIPLISVGGRAHPVRVIYRPPLSGEKPWDGAARCAAEAITILPGEGDVLVFLPGFREIRRARELLARVPNLGAAVVILHGNIPPEEQRLVLSPKPGTGRRIILSTNVAETSLTIPGVRAVVDTGLERRVRYRPRTGMDHWDTAEISMASAEQRKGRAGRLGPGVCIRWWGEADRRENFSPPEIMESDLAPLVLETALWGAASPYDLRWLTAPPRASVERATGLLRQLSLIDDKGRITEEGRKAAGMGLHPRLGHMVRAAIGHGWLATAAVTAAIIEEGDFLAGDDPDFRDRLTALSQWLDGGRGPAPEGPARRIIEEARRIMRNASRGDNNLSGTNIDPDIAGRLLVSAYPDRAAQKTGVNDDGTSRWVLATGRGARLGGPLGREEFLSVAELDGGETDARIFLAAPLKKEDLIDGTAGTPVTEYTVEWNGWAPVTKAILTLGRLVLKESPGIRLPENEAITIATRRIKREGLACLPWDKKAQRLLARCRFVQRHGKQNNWPDFSESALADETGIWLMPFGNFEGGPIFSEHPIFSALGNRLTGEQRRTLDRLAPEFYVLPTGTKKIIDYEGGEIPVIAAKIQEFFGLRETPRLCGIPLVVHLLNPAGRPIQITRDLDGFWVGSYKDVKKEQMGRYPKHFWPDDPRVAAPTSKAKPRKK